MIYFSYKGELGVIRISMCLKEELACATDKWPWVISNIMSVIPLVN